MPSIIREGSWICPNCNAKNRGAKDTCNSCGAVRGNVQFIYEEEGQEITDETEKARLRRALLEYCERYGLAMGELRNALTAKVTSATS